MLSNTNQSQRLIKHIIRSYARLAENPRVNSILKKSIPSVLKEKSFQQSLDESARRWLQNIFKHLNSINSNRSELQKNETANSNTMNSLGSGTNNPTPQNMNNMNNMILIGNGIKPGSENITNNTNHPINIGNSNNGNPNDKETMKKVMK